ncbi:MAG: hypothetical protein ACRETF_01065 [Nevskiaceae bacterium]
MALVCTAGVASAEDYSGYMGLSFGQTSASAWQAFIASGDDGSFGSGGFSSDNTDNSVRAYFGVNIVDGLAFEGGYVRLGEMTAYGTSDGSAFYTAGPVSIKSAVTGYEFAFVGRAGRRDSFALLGRAGLMFWDLKRQLVMTGLQFGANEDGDEIFWGFGVEYASSSALAYRLEVTRFGVDTNDIDHMDTLTLSLVYRTELR